MRLAGRLGRSALLLLLLGSAAAHAQRAELPVREVDLPNGDRRFATTLKIDDEPVEVGIDTGSTGLRVLPRALSRQDTAMKGQELTYSYGAGTGFDGEAITLPVAAGAVAGSVKVMRITTVGCTRDHPNCPVAHLDLSHYGIQGDGIPDQGFAAILGIRLMHDAVENPFTQLGVKRWIIELPRTPAEMGRIVLNPNADEVANYSLIDVDQDGTVPGCLVGPEKLCGQGLFDTGAAGVRVMRSAPFRPWPNGTAASISVGSGRRSQSIAVEIGRRDQATRLLYVPATAETRLSFGFAPYFRWSVLYDAERHQIGVKPR